MQRYRKHQQEVAIKNSEELEVKLKERVSSLQELKDELQEMEEILKTMGDSYSERLQQVIERKQAVDKEIDEMLVEISDNAQLRAEIAEWTFDV